MSSAGKIYPTSGFGTGGGMLPEDALSHDKIAQSLLSHARTLAPGNVIAIQGGWGRGKTDVLKRLQSLVLMNVQAKDWPRALWINPWQYGKPDLITPLVTELLIRVGKMSDPQRRMLKSIAETLLRAAAAVAFKGASVVMQAEHLLEPAAKPVDKFIQSLFGESKDTGDRDPVAKMPERFRELIDAYLESIDIPDARIVICIDDLDRCLPDHQIAILESLHFLTSARAKATFFVAVDPTLLSQAAFAHYRTSGFDTNRYLDKMFDLRINLPSLPFQDLKLFVARQFELPVGTDAKPPSLREYIDRLKVSPGNIENYAFEVVSLPELKNPRLIGRIFDRFRLFLRTSPPFELDEDHLKGVLLWCVASERWPAFRILAQSLMPDRVNEALVSVNVLFEQSNENAMKKVAWLKDWLAGWLSEADRTPDMKSFVRYQLMPLAREGSKVDFAKIDSALIAAAL